MRTPTGWWTPMSVSPGKALSELLRSTEFSTVANNLLDKAYLSAITENAAWLGSPSRDHRHKNKPPSSASSTTPTGASGATSAQAVSKSGEIGRQHTRD